MLGGLTCERIGAEMYPREIGSRYPIATRNLVTCNISTKCTYCLHSFSVELLQVLNDISLVVPGKRSQFWTKHKCASIIYLSVCLSNTFISKSLRDLFHS